MSGSVFIERIVIRNFKSIRECDVTLGPLTFLVGPNGSGKSNFVDAIRFVADALNRSLDVAVSERGGFRDLCRRGADFVEIELGLYDDEFGRAEWGIGLAPAANGLFRVASEYGQLYSHAWDGSVDSPGQADVTAGYHAADASVQWSHWCEPEPAFAGRDPNSVLLTECNWVDGYRELHAALSSMSFHNLSPHAMRLPRGPSLGRTLSPDGANIAAVLHSMARGHPDALEQVRSALTTVVPSVTEVEREEIAGMEAVRFTVSTNGRTDRFYASAMSDGTLRTLGCLVALYQGGIGPDSTGPPLVALEEPELALHPAAVRVLLECLSEASLTRQVIVTSHGSDLLDDEDLTPDSILAVETVDGESRIGHLDGVARQALDEGLFTAGELLRLGQLMPAEGAAQ